MRSREADGRRAYGQDSVHLSLDSRRRALDTSAGSSHHRGIVPLRRGGKSGGVWACGLCVLALWSPLEARGPQRDTAAVAPGGVTREPWFRLFLRDGQILSTVGEFTRVDDTVLVQVPLGAPGSTGVPETRTVTIAAGEVDWPRTDAYRDAIRRAQFVQAGGERAYAAFTEEVAATLRDVAVLPDPLERIRRLEAARVQLARWPATHHGYRAEEVAQTLSVVDDLLNGMRAAAGQQTFTLALSSGTPSAPAAPAAPLLPPPTLQDMISQALGLAPRVADASERMLLLQSAEAMLARSPGLDPAWARTTRRQIHRQINTEATVTRKYERLRAWMLDRTTRLLAAADVRGLMRVREDLVARDNKLERRRPAEVASLLATLDMRLESARRHRLLLQRWTEREPALRAYATVVTPYLGASTPLPRALEDVKALSGPGPGLLSDAEVQLATARADALRASVPDEARTAHQVWLSAQQLATRALQTRRGAISSGNLQQAWEASAAAAGALMLLQQLRADVPALLRPPALPPTGTP